MGTLGPTGTTADVTSFTNFKSWAGTGTFGINTALTNFGWTRTADPNQINWAIPNVPPLFGNNYPIVAVFPLSGTPGPSGTVQPVASTSMVSNAFSTAFANEIVLVVGGSYGSTATYTPGAGWTQDGGTSLNAQSIAAAQHRIFTTLQTGITSPMTDSTNTVYHMFALGLGTNGTPPVLVNFSAGGAQNGPFATTVSNAQNITAGNTIVVCLRWGASKVTDTAGNTYTPLPFVENPFNVSGTDGAQFWYVTNCLGNAANVVTATMPTTTVGGNTFTFMAVWQVSGGPFTVDFTPTGLLSQPGGTYNGAVIGNYAVNCRGTWVNGTTYNYLDVVTSPVTGASYILNRNFLVTNVQVNGPLATITASNNLNVGDKVRFTFVNTNLFLLNQTFTVLSIAPTTSLNTLSTSFVINVSGIIGSSINTNTTETAICGIQDNGSLDPSNNASWSPYHYEIWQSNDAQSFSVTNVARSAGGLATFTCTNRFNAGFNITVAGLTNVPSLNGTWCLASATPTTFTVQTGGGSISSTADSGTATYTFQPMLMKLEYYGNTAPYFTTPWIRVSFGIGGTDGVGNLVGNLVGSNVMETNLTNGPLFCDLRPSTNDTANAQTSSIWQCAASGASPTGTNTVGNAARFGVSLWYSRNDTFATNRGSIYWIIERAYSDAGFATDDYFTYLVGCLGNAGVFTNQQTEIQQRSIMKPNPTATPISVSVVSNVVAISYAPTLSNYQFAVGATVYATNFLNATFLSTQFLAVTATSLSLTSVANTVTTVDTLTAASSAMFGETTYTGTFSPTIPTGTSVTITGFTNLANNGTFTVIGCTATALIVANAFGVTESVSATATYKLTTYTGTVTNGATNFYAGLQITVAGFTSGVNNGTFTCVASSATTLTLSNTAATSETHAATATGNFFITSFTNVDYGPTLESGTLALSTSASVFTPIAGTGLVCLSDPRAACPFTSQTSLIVNGQAPFLPVFPILGFVGNPMTMGSSIKIADQLAHDQIFPATVYGVAMHYNNLQGLNTTDPYSAFGGQNGGGVNGATGNQNNQRTNGLMLRWD
jgi:hypothetical protein